jgi:hypothetical protein
MHSMSSFGLVGKLNSGPWTVHAFHGFLWPPEHLSGRAERLFEVFEHLFVFGEHCSLPTLNKISRCDSMHAASHCVRVQANGAQYDL